MHAASFTANRPFKRNSLAKVEAGSAKSSKYLARNKKGRIDELAKRLREVVDDTAFRVAHGLPCSEEGLQSALRVAHSCK